ncbi:hypothetical protein AQJ46_41685 [Streptomyces canus]|uniref:Uncharacterized protein n=1 Tax=Streptomyces canus TaxID=58343 RepID=A0A101RNT7_9ACTN|nr:hypothetical protein AQJ46_41685 [Streptomyces canus]
MVRQRPLYPFELFCFHFKRTAHDVAQFDGNLRLATILLSRSVWERRMEVDSWGTPRADT